MVLLKSAQKFNASVQVTGLLFLTDRVSFAQTVEGTVANVSAVYDRIVRDASHSNIVVFVDEPIKVRVYPDWAMLGESDYATPALINFLTYAQECQPSPFTAGQHTAMSTMAKHVRVR
jgi:hypothetical protein